MHVCPKSRGIGTLALDAVTKMAVEDGKHAVVGFAEGSLVKFYKRCGWYTYGTYLCPDDGMLKHLISSKPLGDNIVIETNDMW